MVKVRNMINSSYSILVFKNNSYSENNLFPYSKNNVLINKINDLTYEIKMDNKISVITGLESIILTNYHCIVKAFNSLGDDIYAYRDYQDLFEQIELSLIKKPMVPLEVNYLILNFLIWNSKRIKAVIKKVKRRSLNEDVIFDFRSKRWKWMTFVDSDEE